MRLSDRPLIDRAEAAFPTMMAQAGRDAAGYVRTRHWVKSDRRRAHIVARFDHPAQPPLILKSAERPRDTEEFAGILRNHKAAQDALAGHEPLTVPQLLASDVDAQTYLMTYLPGETLLDRCRVVDDHRPLMRKAGAWLSAYHRGTVQEERMFQPNFMAQHMLHLVDEMDRGVRRIKGQKRFKVLAQAVQDWVAPCSGRISMIAAKHGDLNAHNILVSDDSVAAYDFLPYSTTPVGYDIARLLLSYMQMVGDIDAVPKGEVLPPHILDAFFEGYTLVPPDDPGVTFLLRVQILLDWNRMHHTLSAQSILRFGRLRALARKAFGA